MFLVLQGTHKVGGCTGINIYRQTFRSIRNRDRTADYNPIDEFTVEMFEVVLLRPDSVLDDEGVGAGEVGHGAGVQEAV